MPDRIRWTRDELLLALRLYLQLPFGRLSSTTPEIVALAAQLGRTPSALSMKACNFASLDPSLQARNIRGLQGASALDRQLWAEFASNSESLAAEAEAAYERLNPAAEEAPPIHPPSSPTEEEESGVRGRTPRDFVLPDGPTDIERTIRARRVQSFFRAAVLASYESRCAISGLTVPDLLTASHILPWHHNIPRRADPTNGLCLNALFDRAFDRGLLAISPDLRVLISPRLTAALDSQPRLACSLLEAQGLPLLLPNRFPPDPASLDWHRENVFQS